MNGITLPTTEEQRRQFQAIGLTLWGEVPGVEEKWDLNGRPAATLRNGQAPIYYMLTPTEVVRKIDAVLGLTYVPPNMVMVPMPTGIGRQRVLDLADREAESAKHLSETAKGADQRPGAAAFLTYEASVHSWLAAVLTAVAEAMAPAYSEVKKE